MGMTRFVCFLLFIMLVSFSHAPITPTSPLSVGQTLRSSNEVYELGFFSPNNSQNQYVGIWLKGIVPQVVVWVANREKPVTDSTANLTISSNGTLLLFNGENGVAWSSNGETFAANGSTRAELSDRGNLVVKDDVSGRTLWESFEHLGDTLLSFSKLTYNVVTGEKRVLTSWKTDTDPSPGEFVFQITPQVPSQACIMKGSTTYWRSGPWAKTRFSGIPQMDASLTSPISIQQNANGSGSFFFSDRNGELLRTRMKPNGSLETFRLSGTDWELEIQSPANSCEYYGVCGPFGLCVMSQPLKCECFKGFVPKSAEEWKRRNWTDGCVRRVELNCSGKDVNSFHPVANIKPPDFYEFVSFVDAEECKQSCHRNCSCLAFAYIDGIGCLVWNQQLMDVVQYSAGGELLHIRLASSELRGGNRRKKTVVTATVVSFSLFLLLGFATFALWRQRAKHNAKISQDASEDAWRNGLKQQDVSGLSFFEMDTIETATNSFSLSNKLGQGGFGSVYKGKLKDGKEIAVKRLASNSGQGKEEFMNEIELISKLQHKNLVRILGCCIEGEEKLLVYEFMVNKSLDCFLFDSRKRLEIDWPKRFGIIQGIAHGLHYLHRGSRHKVIHRDMKVSNILLDEKMNPKISDFGLARMYQGTEYQEQTRRIAGTLGYMAPEYAWTGMFSEKSDIYSFGVILLEIISGEKISRFTYGEEQKTLVAYAWECWCKNRGIEFLDRGVADSCQQPLEVERCVQVGLLCVQHQVVDRPNTVELLSMLTAESSDLLPSPRQPTFVLLHNTSEDNGLTTVKMTESSLLGR